jgi:hypothetical protein
MDSNPRSPVRRMYAYTEIATDREHRHRGVISAADHPMRQRSRGTDGSNPSPSSGESGANHGLRGDVRHWVCRAAQALGPTRSHCRRASRLYTGASRPKADFGQGLSSFRTYPASLSAGYGGFRSGENQSSLGKRPRFPDGAGFSPNASDKRAPGSPQPGAVLLQICCARSHVLSAPNGELPLKSYAGRHRQTTEFYKEPLSQVIVPPRT